MSYPFCNPSDRRTATSNPFVYDERKHYLARRTSHERRIHFPHDDRLRLNYDMLQRSGSPIDEIVVEGPVPAKTIASNAMSFDSAGLLAFAPHQIVENVNWSEVTGDLPAGWGDLISDAGTVTYADQPGGYAEATFVSTGTRPAIFNNTTVEEFTLYTAGFYFHSTTIVGNEIMMACVLTSGTDCDLDMDEITSGEGWYGTGFVMGNDISVAFRVGQGSGGPATGTSILSRPFIVKGLLPGVGIGNNNGGFLDDQRGPFGRWVGTDDGDEPRYDQPRFAHDPANSNARLGLFEEMAAATNDALWNRDFTDADWVKSNTSAAEDATGLTGIANSASTLTATAADGTCLQTVTQASAENTYSVYIKRKTGTGDIQITDDDGANWTTVSGLSSSVFTRYHITRTIANPVFGIRIRTDTDAIEVDFNQLEAGEKPSSPIWTTWVAVDRAKDVRTTTELGWLNADEGLMFKQAIIPYVSTAEMTLWSIDDGTATDRLRLYMDAAENVNFETISNIGNPGASDGAGVIAVDTVFKVAGVYDNDDVIAFVDGASSGADNMAALPVTDAATISRWGDDNASGTPWAGFTQIEKFYNVRKSNVLADSLTT